VTLVKGEKQSGKTHIIDGAATAFAKFYGSY